MFFLLDSEVDTTVVGISDRLQGLTTQMEVSQAEVLVLEWDLAISDLIDLTTEIHNLTCQPKIIFLTKQADDLKKVEAAGVDYFIVKNSPPDKLLAVLADIRLFNTKDNLQFS